MNEREEMKMKTLFLFENYQWFINLCQSLQSYEAENNSLEKRCTHGETKSSIYEGTVNPVFI
jgi:hypothetical protein